MNGVGSVLGSVFSSYSYIGKVASTFIIQCSGFIDFQQSESDVETGRTNIGSSSSFYLLRKIYFWAVTLGNL